MRKAQGVSEAELEVLKILWNYGESIRQPEILILAEKENKGWKRQTLNTFLARLEKKGLVKREKGVITPVFSEEDYKAMEMQAAIDRFYGGDIGSFLTAFIQRDAIKEEDLREVRRILEQGGKR